MDRETRDSLLETLAGLKASQMQYAARRDKRFWKNNGIPGSLSDVISGLTKEEMNKICKSYGLKRMSSLKKADLAPKLARLVPERFDRVLRTLDQGRYGLLKAVVKNSGMLKGEVETAKARALLGSCLVFPGTYDHEKVVYMPPELIDVFNRTDGAELKRIIKRNTEWITLTHGMLYYYGVIGMRPLLEKIEALTGAKVDLLEFEDVLTPAIKFYRQVHYTASGLRDYRVFDTEKLVNEQKSRQSVDYYPFTKKQLMEAGASECNDRTPVMTSLLDFLAEHYDLNENAKNDLANELIKRINEGNTLNEIIKYLGSRLELPSFEFMQLLTEKTTELYNNTRQWALKGHTPGELFREEKKFLKPLPAKPFAVEQTESKVVDIKTRKKVGRNAPCPCGSGKKFKKCCGG